MFIGLCHIEDLFPFPETPNPESIGLTFGKGDGGGLTKKGILRSLNQ